MSLRIFITFWIILLTSVVTNAQLRISGIVKDKQSDEPIPFAAARFKVAGFGTLTDSAGRFSFTVRQIPLNDTLLIESVGYLVTAIPTARLKDSLQLTIALVVMPAERSREAVVKTKYNRALWFWRKIQSKKPQNDRSRYDNFSYEVYNKLELDLNNVNKEKLGQNKLLKPLNFVLEYVDSTSDTKPYLPVYLTETISDYYYQRNPRRTREVIKATKTNGLDNESIVKQLGGTYQNINIYSNVIPVFDRAFISPLHNNADNYYNFKLLDTQYLGGKRLVHLRFTPKYKGQDVFEGDCWVHDTTFAIQKVTLRPASEANINFITGLSIIQEYKLINDTTWFLYKDRFVADLYPVGSNRLGFKGRKTSTYKNVIVNNESVEKELHKSKLAEDIVLLAQPDATPDSFWLSNRHEQLNKDEQTVYKVLDTLMKNPTYVRYRNTLNFLTTGTKDIGNIRIGPWWYWVSGNLWEGLRTRFDISSNFGFSNKWQYSGYLAYGFKDQELKGKAELRYQISRQPWSYVSASYRKDIDNGQMYYDQIGTDNIFATAFRRPNIPLKFQMVTEEQLEYYTESNIGIGVGVKAMHRQYRPLQNLPGPEFFPTKNGGTPLSDFTTTLRLRFAWLERTFEDNFYRTSLGSDLPIVDIKLTKGYAGVNGSSYNYEKIEATVSDYFKIAPYGSIYFNVFAGRVNGTLPFQLLEVLPGNEMYYYNRYAFNLMNRFEYLTDRYAGFNVEHNIGNGLFRFIPLTRKLKFRQFYTLKGIIGNLSPENQALNFVGNHPFKTLNNEWYAEVGTGVDNIFKFFRIDAVWRVAQPTTNFNPNVPNRSSFGLFGSFRVSF
ncbi:MAG TPA: hypothetical protein DCQ29_08790 [Chitinophagaceae bacterium]|nr:hypothetical protein [Chitinophagaceae bacterium]